jgi:Flp pilus assembly protein TadG
MSEKRRMRDLFARLYRRTDGASAMEFAFVSIPVVTMIMGILEVATIMFVNVVMEGAIRDAARFGITGYTTGGKSRETLIREIIDDRTLGFVDMTKVVITTIVYPGFDSVGPEPLADANGNGQHDTGETFNDVNGNGVWDANPGTSSAGGAGAVVVYKVSYDWPLLTGLLAPLLGHDGLMSLSVSTAVRNEPFPTPPPPSGG